MFNIPEEGMDSKARPWWLRKNVEQIIRRFTKFIKFTKAKLHYHLAQVYQFLRDSLTVGKVLTKTNTRKLWI